MLYVFDSSVAIKTVLPELDSNKAIRLRDEARAAIHHLLAPDFFPMEVGHSLTRAERHLRISPPDGWNGWKAIMADCPQLYPALPLMPRAFDISSSLRIGIYDCIYVALAEREGCGFVTADQKLVNNLQQTFPFVLSLSAMP
jgi:predicted nucleic acid-binding protein